MKQRQCTTWPGRVVVAGLWVLLTGVMVVPVQGAEIGQISAEEFQRSDFAVLFQAGNYDDALVALESPLKRYPRDPLLRRYRAMTLDLVGRSEEAIALFQELLLEDPRHVPTRYFLGQAYERMGLLEESAEQWLWVIGNTPAGLLESDLFSLSNGLTLTADTRWMPHTRTLLAGLAPKKRGPRARRADLRDRKIAVQEREIAQWKARAQRAEVLVEIQKKFSEMVGIPLPENGGKR